MCSPALPQVGDYIVAVDGESVRGVGFEHVVLRMAHAAAPSPHLQRRHQVTVTTLREEAGRRRGGRGAAAWPASAWHYRHVMPRYATARRGHPATKSLHSMS